MDDGVLMRNNLDNRNMGATSNVNGARIVALQERKKSIEESLSKKEKELRELCIQEADLTGIIPSEMPLQPGESPPSIRRKVGTSYMLPESLLKCTNNEDESIVDLELQLQLHANMAEAALGLAHKQNLSKTVRRQHKTEYQHHKKEYKTLQEKIMLLKEAQQHEFSLIDQQKQKKKLRPLDQDDGISIKSNDAFRKSENRQSIRSLRHTLQTDTIAELYPQFNKRPPHRSSDIPFDMAHTRYEDLSSSFYKLNFSGYKSYLERRDDYGPIQAVYNQKLPGYQHIHGSPTFQYNHAAYSTLQPASPLPQHSPLSQHSPIIQQAPKNSSDISNLPLHLKYSNPRYYSSVMNPPHFQTYSKYTNSNSTISVSRQSSPISNANLNKFHHSNSPVPFHNQLVYKNQSSDPMYNCLQNPHQLQPHQQYEHNAGLGGCWKKKESGEVIWCNSSNIIDTSWQRDKRFGSLDRRRNKRIQKRISPNPDHKSATLATSIPYSIDKNKPAVLHSPQVQTRHSLNRQLVRTQSLGSVGVQTLDSVWPSDDNSSCDSENRSRHERSCNTIRRQKQKEWRETSLDSPSSPTLSIISRSQSAIPPVLAPEEKYISINVPSPKSPLEIPAESNPSPRIPDTNLELFNNNIPKNCTIVQAGHCKPYHEETKPFEMSDFYKYSTKFKKSPSKNRTCEEKVSIEKPHNFQRSLNENFGNKLYHQNMLHIDASDSSFEQLDNMGENMDLCQVPMNSQDQYPNDTNMWYSTESSRKKENNNATLV